MNTFTKITDLHAARKTGVGASDIPILAGLSKRFDSTPLTLWQEKTGRVPPWEGNERTKWGQRLEELVLREALFSLLPGGYCYKIAENKTECRHPGHSFAIAHADLVVVPDKNIDGIEPEPFLVEAKTAGMMSGKRREGEIFTGYDPDDLSAQGIPDAVYLQVQWQLFVYNATKAYVAVLIDTADFRIYGPIAADKKVQENCLALATRFWRLIEQDTPPAPETWGDVTRLWPEMKSTTTMIGGQDEITVKQMISRDRQIKARIKELEDERSDIKNAIGILIGENEVLSGAEGDVLAKAIEKEKESVPLTKVRKTAPEIAEALDKAGLITKSSWREIHLKGEK